MMDEEFMQLLEKVFPDGTGTTNSYNADKLITAQDKAELSLVGRQRYEQSCETMKKLLSSRKTDTIPLLYRKAVCFIAYKLYHEAKNEAVQKKVLEDLGLSHNTFGKWGMKPREWYREGFYKGTKLFLYRDGKKNSKLCYVFNEIISQLEYSNFVDLFGGLGAITTSKYPKGKEYINDFDKSVANFLLTISQQPKNLELACKKLLEDIKNKPDKRIIKKGKKALEDRIKMYKEKLRKATEKRNIDDIEKEIKKLEDPKTRGDLEYAMGLYKNSQDKVKECQKSKIKGEIEHELEVNMVYAVAFYYIHAFHFKYKGNIAGVTIEGLKAYKKGIQSIKKNEDGTKTTIRYIKEYGHRLKNVKVACKDFRKIINEFNSENTLLYADPPYYSTKQYNEKFGVDEHIDLHNLLKEFKGKWCVSCRASTSTKCDDGEETEEYIEQVRAISGFLKLYEDIGKYVVEIPINKNTIEIMITNFDFIPPSGQGYNAPNSKYIKEYMYDIEREYKKENYKDYSRRWRTRDIW